MNSLDGCRGIPRTGNAIKDSPPANAYSLSCRQAGRLGCCLRLIGCRASKLMHSRPALPNLSRASRTDFHGSLQTPGMLALGIPFARQRDTHCHLLLRGDSISNGHIK